MSTILPTWPKNELILNTHPTSGHTEFEVYCLSNFLDNISKPPI